MGAMDCLQAIDWSRPWLAHLCEKGQPLVAAARGGHTAWLQALNAVAEQAQLKTGHGQALRFVPDAQLPVGKPYEQHIAETGEVPTRANLHDAFNALIWLHFPAIKAALNRLQAREIDCHGVQSQRGRIRDAVTILDENAVLFVSGNTTHVAALRNFDWEALFLRYRADWSHNCHVWPIGHALLEKLVHPYKAITAHAWVVDGALVAQPGVDHLDVAVATMLEQTPLSNQLFSPLPVMGIPGWDTCNQDAAFYADTQVFRSGRRVAQFGARLRPAELARQPLPDHASVRGEESPDSIGQGDG